MKHVVRRAMLLCALAWVALPSTEARAQPSGIDEGRTRFTRGIDLYKEENFRAALAEFRAAYAAAPSFRIHYNIGQTLYQLQDYAGAVRSFELYLSEGADRIEDERKTEVEADLLKLRPRLARLSFVANVPAAEVSVDDEPHGKVQNQTLLVSAGRRRVTISATGYQSETRVLDVAGGQQLDVKFELKPLGGALTSGNDRAGGAQAGTRPRNRAAFYIGLVATGVLGVGTGVMAIVASSKHSDYEKALDIPNNAQGIADARSSTQDAALAADVLGGATLVSGGLTIVAFALTAGDEPATTARATPRTRVFVGPSAVGLVGSF